MNGTDIFMPSSYTNEPETFLSHFGPEDQLFQRPLLNTLGQNYVPNPRMPPPPQQRYTTFDQTYTRLTPPQRTTYIPPIIHHNEQLPPPPPPLSQQNTNPFIEYQRNPPQQYYEEQIPRQPNNQDQFFTDRNDEQKQHTPIISQRSHDHDSKRQSNIYSSFIQLNSHISF